MASLKPEIIFSGQGVEITNTLAATLVVDAILVLLVLIIAKNIKLVPGVIQNVAEIEIDYFYSLTNSIAGKNVNKIFPWVMSFFIFIFFANIIGLLPGFGTIGFFQEEPIEGHSALVPFLRATTSDFNATLALATVSLVATHAIAIRTIGLKHYLGKFFSF